MAPGGLVEVRVSWPGHPRYLKKKKKSSQRILVIVIKLVINQVFALIN